MKLIISCPLSGPERDLVSLLAESRWNDLLIHRDARWSQAAPKCIQTAAIAVDVGKTIVIAGHVVDVEWKFEAFRLGLTSLDGGGYGVSPGNVGWSRKSFVSIENALGSDCEALVERQRNRLAIMRVQTEEYLDQLIDSPNKVVLEVDRGLVLYSAHPNPKSWIIKASHTDPGELDIILDPGDVQRHLKNAVELLVL